MRGLVEDEGFEYTVRTPFYGIVSGKIGRLLEKAGIRTVFLQP